MNKAISFAVMIILTVGTLRAVADDAPKKENKKSSFEHHQFCPFLKLSSDQKSKMKEAMFNFKDKKIDLKAALEKSRLQYARLVSDPSTDYKTAKVAADEVSANLSKLIAAKQDFKTQIAFEILKPDQRGPALMCEMRRKHRHHRWHGEEHDGA